MYLSDFLFWGAFATLSITAVLFALIAVKTKDSVYAAISLGFVGSSVAGMIALIGFGYLAVFHLIIYVGAAVTFMTFSVLMLKEKPGTIRGIWPLALLNSVLLGVVVFLVTSRIPLSSPKALPGIVEVAETLLVKYWFPMLLTILSLATVIIEGIVIARGGER